MASNDIDTDSSVSIISVGNFVKKTNKLSSFCRTEVFVTLGLFSLQISSRECPAEPHFLFMSLSQSYFVIFKTSKALLKRFTKHFSVFFF